MSRDHGGGVDAAAARWGGTRSDWLDLSTGINPQPYRIGEIPTEAWTALPDRAAEERLVAAARSFWGVPEEAMVLPVPGASAAIARMPLIAPPGPVAIPQPTYNEHAAAFRAAGREVVEADAPTRVYVNPNNPDGRYSAAEGHGAPGTLTVLDESFCDVAPDRSLIEATAEPGTVILKSFGKFWGLAGLRLGFAIGHPATLAPLRDAIGPWAVSGPALEIGARALSDVAWAQATREHLRRGAAALDLLMAQAGGAFFGGTALFRLYDLGDAGAFQERLAEHRILVRTFPYSEGWVRLGLPPEDGWARLEAALA